MHDFTALAAPVWRAVSPIAAHSPGQRPGKMYTAIDTFAFLRRSKNATRPKRVTPHECRGALPLIKKAALTERDTLINALSLTQGVALGSGQQLGLQPATVIACTAWSRGAPFLVLPDAFIGICLHSEICRSRQRRNYELNLLNA